jgi:hypothetical protein
MLQIILVGFVAFVAYVAYNHIASQPGSVQKGTYTDKLNDPEASCPPFPAHAAAMRAERACTAASPDNTE